MPLGFAAEVGSSTYGVISAIKRCRSVMIKGGSARDREPARRAPLGVEGEVLASLAETFPGLDWERQATWFWRRVVQHGRAGDRENARGRDHRGRCGPARDARPGADAYSKLA